MRGRAMGAKVPRRMAGAVRVPLAVLLAASLLGACGDSVLLSNDPIRATTGGSNASVLAEAVLGTWQRIVIFIDDAGIPRSSETTWRFDQGGSTARTVVARDLASGLSDPVVTTGRWRVEDSSLVVAFDPPTGGETRYSASVSGDTLFLASQAYMRVR